MKKITFLLLTSLLVSSCSKVYKTKVERNSLFLNKDYSYEFSQIGKEIYVNDVVNLMQTNQNFVLYLGTEGCVHCKQARPNIIEYVKNSNLNLYHLDTVKEDFYEGEGWDIIPLIGKGDIPTSYEVGTPSLLFFEGLEMKSIIVGSTTLSKVKTAKNAISSRIEISKSYSINSMEEFNNVIEHEDNFLTYIYNTSSTECIDAYQSIKDDFLNSKKVSAVVKTNFFNQEQIISLKEYLHQDLAYPTFVSFKNHQIDEIFVYKNAEDNLSEFINRYL